MSIEIVGPLRMCLTVPPEVSQEMRNDYATQLAFILGNIATQNPDYDMEQSQAAAEWYQRQLR